MAATESHPVKAWRARLRVLSLHFQTSFWLLRSPAMVMVASIINIHVARACLKYLGQTKSWNERHHHHHGTSPCCRSVAVSTIWRHRARSCAECLAAHNPMFCCRRSCSTLRRLDAFVEDGCEVVSSSSAVRWCRRWERKRGPHLGGSERCSKTASTAWSSLSEWEAVKPNGDGFYGWWHEQILSGLAECAECTIGQTRRVACCLHGQVIHFGAIE